MFLIDRCVCGSREFRASEHNDIPLRICTSCEGMHQRLTMNEAEYQKYYEEDYHKGVYTHTFEHDCEVARKRVMQYGSNIKGKVLDFGSGNGAFVKILQESEVDVVGVELSSVGIDTESVYNQELISIHFPTDSFDLVTAHDIIEHLVDPVATCKELFRIIKQEGVLIVDFPDFFSEYGRHHWKEMEHLWFLSQEQLIEIMERIGFYVVTVEKPIRGKSTLYFRKPEQDRASILVPPGIGDSFWSLIKMQGFCEQYDLGLPDVFIQSPDDKERALEFIRKTPILNAAGYKKMTNRHPVFQEAYLKDGRHVFMDVAGCDYFLGFNGGLRYKKSMDQMLPECKADWDIPFHESLKDKKQQKDYREQFGQYIVAYFVPHGMYKSWLNEFNVAKITQSLESIQKQLGCRVVFMGARWDVDSLPAALCKDNENFIDLTNKTDMDQMFALIKASMGVIGFPAGNTIIATVLGTPTLLFWNRYFCQEFWTTSCPPASLNNWYTYLDTAGCTPELVSTTFLNLLSRHL